MVAKWGGEGGGEVVARWGGGVGGGAGREGRRRSKKREREGSLDGQHSRFFIRPAVKGNNDQCTLISAEATLLHSDTIYHATGSKSECSRYHYRRVHHGWPIS